MEPNDAGQTDHVPVDRFPAHTVLRAVDAEFAMLDSELVVLEPVSETVHHIVGPLTAVWLLADGETPLGAMLDELSELFELAVADLEPAVQEAIGTLEGSGLLVVEGVEAYERPEPMGVAAVALDGSVVGAGAGSATGRGAPLADRPGAHLPARTLMPPPDP
jgi:hypothetical protein